MRLTPALTTLSVLSFVLVGVTPVDIIAQDTESPTIGSRRELFVDHYLIDTLQGTTLRLHHPKRAGVALQLDQPWEGIVCGYFTVLHDKGRYLMYYRGWPAPKQPDTACVAESTDGKTWTRPKLGLYEVQGTKDNNVILMNTPACHNFAPFIDRKPGVPAAERFKAVGGSSHSGLLAFVSADGARWKQVQDKPIITGGAFDSQNVVFWSDHEDRYLCYYRTFRHGCRWITRTTSENFLTGWTKAVDMSFGDAPPEHLYTNQTMPYFRAPHIYVGTAARFMPNRWALSPAEEQAIDLKNPRNYQALGGNLSDSVLLTTRGGNSYQRTFLESHVRAGGDLHDWVARSNYPARGVVPTGDNEISMYVQRHYGQTSGYLERLTLRTDGFVSVNAPYGGGEMVTKPFTFSGKALELNFSTSAAGSIRVEIQNPDGKPHAGFALADCPEIIGDKIERIVAWKGGGDVGSLAGKTVRLRFAMKDADLFALRFR